MALFLTGAQTLAAPTCSFAHLFTALYARLEIVPTPLEFTQDALGSHLTFQVLYSPLNALVADLDLE